MRELYNEFFHIPKHGKIREKVMLTRISMTIVILVVCLAAMSITAYAYFSHNVTSVSNVIQTADFDLSVSVTTEGAPESAVEPENGIYLLQGGNRYSIQLEKTGTAKTGFCIVETSVGDVKATYHTQQIGIDGTEEHLVLTFTFDLTELSGQAVEVKFTPHWGTSHYYGYESLDNSTPYIKEEDEVKIVVEVEAPIDESQEGAPDTDETPTTDSSTASESTDSSASSESTDSSASSESTDSSSASESTDSTTPEPSEEADSDEKG